jgi:hypothetical protein
LIARPAQALVPIDQLEQVGDVGGMQRLDQVVNPLGFAAFQRFERGGRSRA